MNHNEAIQYIQATLKAFGPGEAVTLTHDTWANLHTAMTALVEQPEPLTDEEMRECAQAMNAEPLAEGWPELIKFARAIERAHGIGEQHE